MIKYIETTNGKIYIETHREKNIIWAKLLDYDELPEGFIRIPGLEDEIAFLTSKIRRTWEEE